MRFAGELGRAWQFYKNNSDAQDVVETSLYAGAAAIGQELFTDMESDDIAIASLVGANAAMAGRKLGRHGGFALGRHLDNVTPELFSDVKHFMPSSRDGVAFMTKGARNTYGKGAGKSAYEVLKAKHNQVAFRDKEQTIPRGDAEALLGYYLGNRGDNIVQAGVALAAPALMGIQEDER